MYLVEMDVCKIGRWIFPALAGLGCLVSASCSRPAQVTSTVIPSLDEQLGLGETIYNQSCANCHYDGSGNPAAADLKGSATVKAGAPAVIRVILRGQQGVAMVDGKKLNGIMPQMSYLSDQEAAAVTAYVRSAFAGQKEVVDPAVVSELRK